MDEMFYDVYKEFCCLDLVRAEKSGYVDVVVSGVFFGNGKGCKEGVPRIKYCPFCGAKIISTLTDKSWSWEALKKEA